MDADAPSVEEDTDVETVIRLLGEHEIPGIPVLNDGGRCVGIVTESDLVLPGDDGDLHLPHYVNLFGALVFIEPLKHFEDRLKKAFAATAADMMTADPTMIEPDATAEDAAKVIHESGHNRLPVAEHGRYIGVVSRADVLGALVG